MPHKRNHRRRQAARKAVPKAPPKQNLNRAVLIVLLVLSLGLGIWFALAPMLESERTLSEQQQILTEYEDRDSQPTVSAPAETTPAPTSEPLVLFEPVPESLPEAVPYTIPENSGSRAIGTLEIDRIGLKLPVVEGIDKMQLDVALGHIPETAPVGGVGNAVIAGHRSYAYGKFLNRLGEVEVGDKLAYTDADGQRYTFSVYEILELLPDDQSAFEQYTEKSVLSLYTCTPIRTATHRLVVRAERIE